MKALFRCEKNWQKINVQRFSANFLFSKNGKCRSITYSGDFATLPFRGTGTCENGKSEGYCYWLSKRTSDGKAYAETFGGRVGIFDS